MMKKKIISLALVAMMSLMIVVPTFADTTVVKDPAVKEAKLQAKAEKLALKEAKEAEIMARLLERATKLGINIEGLTIQDMKIMVAEARATKLEGVAAKLGLNFEGLSKDEIKALITAAKEERAAAKLEKETLKAEKDAARAEKEAAKAAKDAAKAEKDAAKANKEATTVN